MSKSEDDLREFVRVLEALAQEAKSPSDLNTKLLSDASARLADASARATMEIKEASRRENNHFVLSAVQCFKAQWNVVRFGPELSDPMARGLVDSMVSNKQLSLKQRRRSIRSRSGKLGKDITTDILRENRNIEIKRRLMSILSQIA